MALTKEKVNEFLKKVEDPEIGRDIVSLGMVKEVGLDGGNVFIHLEMVPGSSNSGEKIKALVRSQLQTLEGVLEVTVQISSSTRQGPVFKPASPLPGIQYIVAVASGKGGVGKTTTAVNLSLALLKAGYKVGLMDADIYGPNVPLMLGVPSASRPQVSDDEKMIPLPAHGLKMISMGVLVAPDQPMIWRGPMLHSAVTQFLQKVAWGELDFLVIDLPPGTGDVQLSLVQSVPLSGAVVVSTPQEVALMDVRKSVAMFRKTKVPILGVVENMAGDVFGEGGGEKAAMEFQVPFLGRIPLDPRIRVGGDDGSPIVVAFPEAPASKAFCKAADLLLESLQSKVES